MVPTWVHLFRQAVFDPGLSPMDVRVLLAAGDVLDFIAYRPLKAWAVAQMLGIAPSTARSSLEHLVAAGFLDRRPATQPRVPADYRLPATRRPEPTRLT